MLGALGVDGLQKLISAKKALTNTPSIFFKQKQHKYEKAFIVNAKAGTLFGIPAGYLVMQNAPVDCWMLSWSIASAKDVAEFKTMLSQCLSVAASYPAMAVGQYKNWMASLQDHCLSSF